MGILVTDTSGVWLMGRSKKTAVSCGFPHPCQPCAAAGLVAVACAHSRECMLIKKNDRTVVSRMPCVPGISVMSLSPCGRYLYQLSSEADCVHTLSAAAGELLFAAPAGVFPRMMQLRQGKLLVAGGAVGEARLFTVPELVCQRVIFTRHACFAADAWNGGYALVCASEGEDIHTVVCVLSEKGVRTRTLLELPGLPGTMTVCPDGIHALLTTADGLMKISLMTGAVLWNQPEWALSMRILIRGEWALVSDSLTGNVGLINHERPWEKQTLFCGQQAQACFL